MPASAISSHPVAVMATDVQVIKDDNSTSAKSLPVPLVKADLIQSLHPTPTSATPVAAAQASRSASSQNKTATPARTSGESQQSHVALLQRHHLPEPPAGAEWKWLASRRGWILEGLVEADVVGYDENSQPASIPSAEAPDFLEHWTSDFDSLPGVCLQYGITPTQLRRANYGFSGNNLCLAPNPLKIPNVRKATPMAAPMKEHTKGCEKVVVDMDDRDKQLAAMRLLFHGVLAETEIKCYLALNDWHILKAISNAQADLVEKTVGSNPYGERARFDTPVEQVMIDEDLM